jgi:hypothetical protein
LGLAGADFSGENSSRSTTPVITGLQLEARGGGALSEKEEAEEKRWQRSSGRAARASGGPPAAAGGLQLEARPVLLY